jgi:hypothetical protein
MFALALRRVSPDMGRSLAQRLRTHQSQIPLRSIEFLDVLIFTSNLKTSGSACKEVIEHIQVCDSQLYGKNLPRNAKLFPQHEFRVLR